MPPQTASPCRADYANRQLGSTGTGADLVRPAAQLCGPAAAGRVAECDDLGGGAALQESGEVGRVARGPQGGVLVLRHHGATLGDLKRPNAERAERIGRFESRRLKSKVDAFVVVAHPRNKHLDPRLPTDPWTLGQLVAKEEHDVFPCLYARLHAQLGDDVVAEEIWSRATGWEGNKAVGREQLLASAKDWRSQRPGA